MSLTMSRFMSFAMSLAMNLTASLAMSLTVNPFYESYAEAEDAKQDPLQRTTDS